MIEGIEGRSVVPNQSPEEGHEDSPAARLPQPPDAAGQPAPHQNVLTRQGWVQEPLTFAQKVALCAPYLAEFWGCMMLALAWNSTELGKASTNGEQWKPLVLGLTLMVSTCCFASVSGAHLNPAVSLSVGLSNHGDWSKLAKFMVCQLLGSFSGVGLSCLTFGRSVPYALGPRPGFNFAQCFVVEFLYAGFLCFVFLNVTVSKHNNPIRAGNQHFPVAIGFMMAAGCWAGGDISGALFNPATSIAVDLQCRYPGYGFSYAAAQFFGSFVFSLLHRIARPMDGEHSYSKWLEYWSDMSEKTITLPKLCSEFCGSWVVVFTFGMTTLSTHYKNERPLAAGAALTGMHYALSDISGGYFNPAVLLSVLLNGRDLLSIQQGVAYAAAQIVGGAFAAFCYTFVYWGEGFGDIPKGDVQMFGYGQMSAVELVYAFLLCYVALATITVKGIRTKVASPYYSGLAYGLSCAAGGFAMVHLTNSTANPALTLGVALAHTLNGGTFYKGLSGCFVEFLGAVIASGVFRVTHAREYRRGQEEATSKAISHKESSRLLDKAQARAEEGTTGPAKAG